MRRLVSGVPQAAARDMNMVTIGATISALVIAGFWPHVGAADEIEDPIVKLQEVSPPGLPAIPPNRYFQDKHLEIAAQAFQIDLDLGQWRSKFGEFGLRKTAANAESLFTAPQLPELNGEPLVVAQAQVQPPAAPEDVEARLLAVEKQLDELEAIPLNPLDVVLPGVSSNVPVAYGASHGLIAVGIGYQNRIRYSDSRDDGAVAAVVGFGDPTKLGIDLQLSLLDLSRPTDDLALGFKLHRQLPNDYAVALGGENAQVWGRSDSDASYYAVVSKKLRLKEDASEAFSRLYLSAGVGTGRFRTESDVALDRGSAGLFGSAAINVHRTSTAFVEWNGQSLDVGTSIVPLRKLPLVVTLTAADLAGGGGDGTRYTVGIGYVVKR